MPRKSSKQKIMSVIQTIFGWVIGLFVVFTAGVLSYEVATNPQTPGPVYLALINLNLMVAMGFIMFIGRKVLLMFIDRHSQMRNARLQLRMLAIFSILAIVPAVVVSGFSILMLNKGIETWFSDSVNTALEGSLQVAQSYIQEQEKNLMLQAQSIATDQNLQITGLLMDPESLQNALEYEKKNHKLSEISLYDDTGVVIASAYDLNIQALSNNELNSFAYKSPAKYHTLSDGQLTALVPVTSETWLVVRRWIPPHVLAEVKQTGEAFTDYNRLKQDRWKIRLIFSLFLVLLAVASLVGAIWAGLRLASRIVKPVTNLVHATNQVTAGDLKVHVNPLDDDEVGILTQSFNRMTRQLAEGRTLLERKNRELDDRRRVIEAVLTGVSAGIMSVDESGVVRILNKSARELLNVRVGQRLQQVNEELATHYDDFIKSQEDLDQIQMVMETESGPLTLLVRMVALKGAGGKVKEVVVTFDNITELLSAQKVAAWSDVARKLAHEIKNPLTPIQLSAERLKRKYLATIKKEDQATFSQLTETIGKQVEDMRSMLNEFSDFARMPAAVFEPTNIVDVIEEILVLQRAGRGNIEFKTSYDKKSKTAEGLCDRLQMTRALTNIIENAVNAVEERPEKENEKGEIKIVVKMSQGDTLTIVVQDNGKGLPEDTDIERLFDPYMTTRRKGTGLGLAIVRKVMDEHKGQVRLMRRKPKGTTVELSLPLVTQQ